MVVVVVVASVLDFFVSTHFQWHVDATCHARKFWASRRHGVVVVVVGRCRRRLAFKVYVKLLK